MSAGEIQVSKSSSDDLESGSLDTVRDCLSFDTAVSQVHHTANVGINKGGRDGCNGSKQMLRSAWKQKPSGEDQAGTTTNRGPQDKKCSSSDVFAHAPMYTSSYEKFERKLMDNIHLGPILVISIILIRLGLLHVLNQSFHHDDEAFIAAYNIICVLCFLCVWGSVVLNSFQNRTVLSKVKGDNAVMVSVCVGFSLLLVLMSMHDLQASDDDHQGRIFDGDAGFSLYHEMLVYVLAVPVMLQIALSHLTLYGMVLGWTPCLAAVLAMLFIVDLPHHSNLTTPFVIALVSKSLLLMLYIRKQRTSLLRMYTQLEDMKSSHNELIDELEGKKQEMVEQRHMIANIAHDLKTVSNTSH